MNISLCITVLNEERSISRLLDSVFLGTKKPDEIVIVDGGSSDATASVIINYQLSIINKFPKINFKLIKLKNASIAKGRNLAIKNSIGDVIVQTDAGCVVKKDWLEKITHPFNNKNVFIVAGFYEMPAKNALQAAINVFHGTPVARFNPKKYMPSARSVAFRKVVWENIGGYKDSLKNAGEDTLFFAEAVKNYKMERVGDARVIWEECLEMNFKKLFNKFFNYAKGDYQTKIWLHPTKSFMSHNVKILSVFIRYIFIVFLLALAFFGNISPLWPVLLFVFYLIWSILKWRDVSLSWQSRLILPLVQVLTDFAVMGGFISGILEG